MIESVPLRRFGERPGSEEPPSPEAWLRERARLERRARLPDWILAYADALGRAERSAAVHEALVTYAPMIVGAYTAIVYRQPAGAGPEAPFLATPAPRPAAALPDLPDLPADAVLGCAGATVIAAGTPADHDVAETVWTPLLDRLGAAQLACMPLGEEALLVLAERRRDRILTSEDWDLLRSIVRLAEQALRPPLTRRC